MTKRMFIILLTSCITAFCIYADGFRITPDQATFPSAKSPEGIYFQNKRNISNISSQPLPGFSSFNSGSTYDVKKPDNGLEKSMNIRSGDRIVYTEFNMKMANSTRAIDNISSSSVNVTLLSEKVNASSQDFYSPLVDDNPSIEGPGGNSSGNVEAHVGAPVGEGVSILLCFTLGFFYYKRKKLFRQTLKKIWIGNSIKKISNHI